jgi:hypothetical protein
VRVEHLLNFLALISNMEFQHITAVPGDMLRSIRLEYICCITGVVFAWICCFLKIKGTQEWYMEWKMMEQISLYN